MKKALCLTIILATILLAFNGKTYAQKKKDFKGIITFDISYAGSIEAAQLAQLPKTSVTKILGNKTRVDISQGPANITQIVDGDAKTTLMLLDVMGQKFAIKQTKDQIEAELKDQPAPIVKYIDESKEIAGYKVKKAEILTLPKDSKDTVKVTCWYTDEIGSQDMNFSDQFRGLKGFALGYEMKANDIIMSYTAKEVKKGGVKDTDFLQPTDFKEITKEELQNMFGGGGGEEE